MWQRTTVAMSPLPKTYNPQCKPEKTHYDYAFFTLITVTCLFECL